MPVPRRGAKCCLCRSAMHGMPGVKDASMRFSRRMEATAPPTGHAGGSMSGRRPAKRGEHLHMGVYGEGGQPGEPRKAEAWGRMGGAHNTYACMLTCLALPAACARPAGYRQELRREFTTFNCFGASFAALSSFTAVNGRRLRAPAPLLGNPYAAAGCMKLPTHCTTRSYILHLPLMMPCIGRTVRPSVAACIRTTT